MKKLVLGLLSAAMVLGTAGFSFARQNLSQFSSYGYYRAAVSFVNNFGFDEDRKSDDHMIYQRVRQYFEYSANENLTAQVAYEIDNGWGWDGGHFGNDAAAGKDDGFDGIEIKRAQLNFNWPNTEVYIQAGLAGYTTPGSPMGTPVLGGDMPGVFINAPINDMVSVTFGYVRSDDEYRINDGDSDDSPTSGDSLDAFVASVPLTYEGFNLTPFGVYASIGESVMNNNEYGEYFDNWCSQMGTIAGEAIGSGVYEDDVDAYWVGMPFGINLLDPLSINGQFIYGAVDAGQSMLDREGYFFDLSVDYAMDLFTPSLYFYYSSGEDDDTDDGSETFPILWNDGYYYPPAGAALGFNTMYGFGDGDYCYAQYVPHGVWSLGFALKDIQFIDKLSHTFAIAYSQGTNDEDAFTEVLSNGKTAAEMDDGDYRFTKLTTEDESIEMTFYNYYQIYENLKAVLELDYATLDMDEDVWRDDYKDDDVYRCTFGLSYDF